MHLESKGSIFNRDEKAVLMENKEVQRTEMRQALEQQIAEKKRNSPDFNKRIKIQPSHKMNIELTTTPIAKTDNKLSGKDVDLQPTTVEDEEQSDHQWKNLKLQIDALNKEKSKLLKEIENKDQIIETILTDRSKKIKPKKIKTKETLHKFANSADYKSKKQRRLNEKRYMDSV